VRKLRQESVPTGDDAERAGGNGCCARGGTGAEYAAARCHSSGTDGSRAGCGRSHFRGARIGKPAVGGNGRAWSRPWHSAAAATAAASRDAEAG
jgi:hypothetical protein